MTRGISPTDDAREGASIEEAEILVGFLMSDTETRVGKSPGGAANLLLMALAILTLSIAERDKIALVDFNGALQDMMNQVEACRAEVESLDETKH